MIGKLLIANRGEIACRVIATCHRLGIRTVAVYSDADANARHVVMADEAVRIGPAPVSDSYLCGDRIIAAAQATGAEAIHPGYGFLSENPEFVDAVSAAGLIFVGPSAAAIRAMGLKDAAKALMIDAGVPVVPGYHGADQAPEVLAAEAARIGYPVLIKARAGGGGKGMRRVDTPSGFHAALVSAQREAAASFGDPVCLIEKYIAQPRHIEIQVFGDAHGTVIHLFERDCSLQRRHQKVIEEAPAPGMTASMRAAMGQAAIEAAQAIGYTGAGTVEFIVDGTGPLRPDGFWFMEMNTRLQVEHPVSEAITGLDFVELQLRVAAGEPLPLRQDDLNIDGWAFEARLYAEDAGRGFLPATGRLDHLAFPTSRTFDRGTVRIDSGVIQGDAITPWYDPMIAKVVVHGRDRASALSRLRRTLAGCRVAGVTTNLAFLGALTAHPNVAAGAVDTGLIARDVDQLTQSRAASLAVRGVAALAVSGGLDAAKGDDPWAVLTGWRHWGADWIPVALNHDGVDLTIDIMQGRDVTGRDGAHRIRDGASEIALTITAEGDGYRVRDDDHSFRCHIHLHRALSRVTVFCDGHAYAFDHPDPLARGADDSHGTDALLAPMPGQVKVLSTMAGASVTKGDALLVLEAMKMEHTLRAPRDGVIAVVHVSAGDQVSDGELLLTMEPGDG